MSKQNRKTDVTKIISIRMPAKIYNEIIEAMNNKTNKLETKTDVIKFALKHVLEKGRFQTIYKIDRKIKQNNIDLFASIHNYMGNENAYTSAVNHIGVNINQIAHRINGKSKSGEPQRLNTDDIKAIQHGIKIIKETKHEIEANQNDLINDEVKIIKYFDKDKAGIYRKMNKTYRKLIRLYKYAIKTYVHSVKFNKSLKDGSDK